MEVVANGEFITISDGNSQVHIPKSEAKKLITEIKIHAGMKHLLRFEDYNFEVMDPGETK
ncbi:hypothetical protein [Carnobacterium maltaromaticum]|uniref:hypothetical protein n=1 Tax=Carnobacterium maltaromaticum TaxID=2751 RepID=UPI00191B9818|nr:hypothetical protein [Carnobacterium maltaromaticum]CAD5896894.1 conserved hypothetical protein [Carnobacterium maltaromaticum]